MKDLHSDRPRKVLFIQTAFLGDVILATAALETWHQTHPADKIYFLVNQKFAGVVAQHPFATILTWDKSTSAKYRKLWQLLQTIRNQRFDIVINFQRYAATGLLAVLSGAAETRGFDKNPFSSFFTRRFQHRFRDDWHEIDRNHELIKDLVSQPSPALPKLYPSAADKEHVARRLEEVQKSSPDKPIVILAPGSVWPTKIWPEEHWQALVSRLVADYTPILIGGKEEQPLCDRLSYLGAINWAGQLSLMQSVSLMERSLCAYVQDSAPMHMATAVGLKTCAIYCSTAPIWGFGPKSPESIVYQLGDLACRPCDIKGLSTCPKGHFRCGKDLSPYQVPLPRQWANC